MTDPGADQPLRVVLVDDEPDIRLMLSLALPQHGLEVVGEAGDGAEALALCDEVHPDAMVLDLLMPGVNGFEAIPQIKSRHPEVGVVAYTAVAGDFVRNEMRRLGIPLVLKQSSVVPLVEALHDAARHNAAQARADAAGDPSSGPNPSS